MDDELDDWDEFFYEDEVEVEEPYEDWYGEDLP